MNIHDKPICTCTQYDISSSLLVAAHLCVADEDDSVNVMWSVDWY